MAHPKQLILRTILCIEPCKFQTFAIDTRGQDTVVIPA